MGLRCPHCNFEQPPGLECVRCGTVFAKWGELARRSATPHHVRVITPMPAPLRPPADAPAPNPRLMALLAALVAATLGGIGVTVHRVRQGAWERGAAGAREVEETEAPPASSAGPGEPRLGLRRAPAVARGPGGLVPPDAGRRPSPTRPAPRDEDACRPFTGAPAPSGAGAETPADAPGWRLGAEGWDEAVRHQVRTGAPLLAVLVRDDCAPCRALRRDVLDLPTVAEFLRAVIKVQVNADESPTARAAARALGLSDRAQDAPAVLVVSAPGRIPLPVPAVDDAKPGRPPVAPERFIADVADRLRKEAGQLVMLGYDLYRDRDLVRAEEALDSALRIDSRSADAWFWRGAVRRASGAALLAIHDLRVAAALDASRSNPWAELTAMSMSRECWEEAVLYTTRLLESAVDAQVQGRARSQRARALKGLGRTEDAARDADAACALGHVPSCASGAPP